MTGRRPSLRLSRVIARAVVIAATLEMRGTHAGEISGGGTGPALKADARPALPADARPALPDHHGHDCTPHALLFGPPSVLRAPGHARPGLSATVCHPATHLDGSQP